MRLVIVINLQLKRKLEDFFKAEQDVAPPPCGVTGYNTSLNTSRYQ